MTRLEILRETHLCVCLRRHFQGGFSEERGCVPVVSGTTVKREKGRNQQSTGIRLLYIWTVVQGTSRLVYHSQTWSHQCAFRAMTAVHCDPKQTLYTFHCFRQTLSCSNKKTRRVTNQEGGAAIYGCLAGQWESGTVGTNGGLGKPSNGPRGQTVTRFEPGKVPHCHSLGTRASYEFMLSPVSAIPCPILRQMAPAEA